MTANRVPFQPRICTEKPTAPPSGGPNSKHSIPNKTKLAKTKPTNCSTVPPPPSTGQKRPSDDDGDRQKVHKQHRRGASGELKGLALNESFRGAASPNHEPGSLGRAAKSKTSAGQQACLHPNALFASSNTRAAANSCADETPAKLGSNVKGTNPSIYISQTNRLDDHARVAKTHLLSDAEIVDSEARSPTSSNLSSDDARFIAEDLERDAQFTTGKVDPIPSDDQLTENGAELGLPSNGQMTIYPPISYPSVIDIEPHAYSLREPRQAYAMYIAKTTFWDISKEPIPTGGKQLADWECTGQKLASQFADLIKEFVKLRRHSRWCGGSIWLTDAEKRSTSIEESMTDSQGTHVSSRCAQRH